jgi:PAS domain S-box-containing protein
MLGVITHYDGYLLDITERKRMVEDLHTFKAVAENAPDGICISDMDGVITYGNTAYNRLLGYSSTVGLHMADMATPDEQQRLPEIVHVLHQQGTWVGNYHYQRQDETQFIAQTSWSLMRDEHGHPRAIAAIIRDITEQRRAEEERTLLQQQVIEAQQNAIRELSTPLIPLAHNVVLMPLIGSIDTTRAQLVMETLLEGIAMHQADTAILDITGVSVVDTQVANALIQAAQAVRLLGAQVILTGIGPTMAQTLVHLGTDLSSIITRGSLQTAVVEAVQDHITAPVATRK